VFLLKHSVMPQTLPIDFHSDTLGKYTVTNYSLFRYLFWIFYGRLYHKVVVVCSTPSVSICIQVFLGFKFLSKYKYFYRDRTKLNEFVGGWRVGG
jgi:hypothetical protein